MAKKYRDLLNHQRGAASMATVAMFTLVFAVVAVGFTYITVSMLHNSTNKSQESMAKQAAESGIEDAKRVLAKCTSPSTDIRDLCAKIANGNVDNQSCDQIIGDANVGKILNGVDSGKKEVNVGSGTSYECLKINSVTDKYTFDTATKGSVAYIPLNMAYDTGNDIGDLSEIRVIKIQWHKNGDNDGQDGDVRSFKNDKSIVSASERKDNPAPAVVRVERVVFNPDDTSVEKLILGDSAMTLVPSSKENTDGKSNKSRNGFPVPDYGTNGDFNSTGINKGESALQPVYCRGTDYLCEFKINTTDWGTFANRISGKNDILSVYKAYLRVNVIYGNNTPKNMTHLAISVEGVNGAGGSTPLKFKNVQPEVEVTGKAGDSRSRLKAKVQVDYTNDFNGGWVPQNAIETNGSICKDLDVYHDSATDNCVNH